MKSEMIGRFPYCLKVGECKHVYIGKEGLPRHRTGHGRQVIGYLSDIASALSKARRRWTDWA